MSTMVTAVLLTLSLANACFSLPVTTTTQNSTDAGGQPQPQDTDDGGASGVTIGCSVGGSVVFLGVTLYVGYRCRSKILNFHCCHHKPHYYGNGDKALRSKDSGDDGPAANHSKPSDRQLYPVADNSLAVVSASNAGAVLPCNQASTSYPMSSYVREALTGVQEAGHQARGIRLTRETIGQGGVSYTRDGVDVYW